MTLALAPMAWPHLAMSILVFALGLLAAAPQVETRALTALPEAFHGEWLSDLEHCGTSDNDRLIITADQLRFYDHEVGFTELDILTGVWLDQNRMQMTLTFELDDMVGEVIWVWHLSSDGKTLSVERPDGGTYARQLCPAG